MISKFELQPSSSLPLRRVKYARRSTGSWGSPCFVRGALDFAKSRFCGLSPATLAFLLPKGYESITMVMPSKPLEGKEIKK